MLLDTSAKRVLGQLLLGKGTSIKLLSQAASILPSTTIIINSSTTTNHHYQQQQRRAKHIDFNLIKSSTSLQKATMSSYSQHIFQTLDEKEDQLKSVSKVNWTQHSTKDAIVKTFEFRNFVQAFSFMTAVALEAEKIDHHPEWSNVYNKVEIALTSHFCNGVSLLDIKMARTIDNIYNNMSKS